MKTKDTIEGTETTNTETATERKKQKTVFMTVSARGGILLDQKQVPIFRRKKGAKSIADKVQGKVVRAVVSW